MKTVTYKSQGGTLRITQRFWTKRGAQKFLLALAESGRKGWIS